MKNENDLAKNTYIFKKRPPLSDAAKEAIILKIKKLAQGKVLAAYVFGSFFTPEFHAESDIDLIFIMETASNFVERPLEFPQIFDLEIPVDLLVYTPSEFAQLRENPSIGFWSSALTQLRRII